MEVDINLVREWWEPWLLISVGMSRSAALAAVQIFMVTKFSGLLYYGGCTGLPQGV